MKEKAIVLRCGRCGDIIHNNERRFYPYYNSSFCLCFKPHPWPVHICEKCYGEIEERDTSGNLLRDCEEILNINEEE